MSKNLKTSSNALTLALFSDATYYGIGIDALRIVSLINVKALLLYCLKVLMSV